MSISDLAEAYSILVPSLSQADRELATERLFAAWLGAASVYEGAVAPQPDAEYPGYESPDFEEALKAAGYIDIDTAWRKWSLEALPIMGLDDRVKKMASIKALSRQVQESSVGQVLKAPFEGNDTSRCPICDTSGKKFSWGYSCDNRECIRPNGKHTTWDDKNWQARKAE